MEGTWPLFSALRCASVRACTVCPPAIEDSWLCCLSTVCDVLICRPRARPIKLIGRQLDILSHLVGTPIDLTSCGLFDYFELLSNLIFPVANNQQIVFKIDKRTAVSCRNCRASIDAHVSCLRWTDADTTGLYSVLTSSYNGTVVALENSLTAVNLMRQ